VDQGSIAAYAADVIRLADGNLLAPPFSATGPYLSIHDAYAIANEVRRRRETAGWRRAGRKIGFTNRTIYDQYGVRAPIFGYMYDRTIAEAAPGPSGPEATLSLAGLAQPQIEPEIYFVLRSAPASTQPSNLLAAIESFGHGFEIVQCHFPEWRFAAADTIADLGLHGRYVLGPRLPLERGSEATLAQRLSSFRVALDRDGVEVAGGGGALVLDSPLNALAHLVEVLATLPEQPPLAAGEIITTGTLTAAMPVAPGQTWTARFKGLETPPVRLQLT
jgi:2-oxo-3-hexenedioate decarboxylase